MRPLKQDIESMPSPLEKTRPLKGGKRRHKRMWEDVPPPDQGFQRGKLYGSLGEGGGMGRRRQEQEHQKEEKNDLNPPFVGSFRKKVCRGGKPEQIACWREGKEGETALGRTARAGRDQEGVGKKTKIAMCLQTQAHRRRLKPAWRCGKTDGRVKHTRRNWGETQTIAKESWFPKAKKQF